MKFLIAPFFIFILSSAASAAKHMHPEKEYKKFWCDKMSGTTDFLVSGSSRIDCLTDEYAVDFDFASDWREALKQALVYGRITGHKPGIALIIEHPSDKKFLNHLAGAIKKQRLSVRIWTVRPEDIVAY